MALMTAELCCDTCVTKLGDAAEYRRCRRCGNILCAECTAFDNGAESVCVYCVPCAHCGATFGHIEDGYRCYWCEIRLCPACSGEGKWVECPTCRADRFGVMDAALADAWLYDREREMLPMLLRWLGDGLASPGDLNRLLAEHWSGAGYPAAIGAANVVRLFAHAGFVAETSGTVPPTQPLTLYRGARRSAPRGVCWTTNPAVATWFAARGEHFGAKGMTVFTARVSPKGVLGIFLERKESEVVVNPKYLRGVRELAPTERPALDGDEPPGRPTL